MAKVNCPNCKEEKQINSERLSGCGHKHILECTYCGQISLIWKDEQGSVQIQKRPSLDDITEFKTQQIEFDPKQPNPVGEVLLQEGKNYSLMYIQAYLQEPGNEGKYIVASPDGGKTKALVHNLVTDNGFLASMQSLGIVFFARNACINHTALVERLDIVKIHSL